ncbi:MAG: UDP-N-acetylmuramate dehydrogenase [Candidatus Zixiibacteriota bacterium]|nr:MAG: UDP-N-acetylmuramate dehydrogenase [candidate division Zixibacteria bacterium]
MSKKTVWDFESSLALLERRFGSRITVDRSLADFNTFGTGGAAKLLIEVRDAQELSGAVEIAAEHGIPFFMVGGGSNLLVSDIGYDGLIIKNSIMGLNVSGKNITAGAGEELQTLVNFATDNALTGLEFATGIWGTVGGAIYGNAGAYGGETGEFLDSAEVVDRQGNIRTEGADYFEFSYRGSKLKKSGEFVTRATFALKEGKKEAIRKKIDEIMALRDDKFPIGLRSAGCFFKNIPDSSREHGKLSTGMLLEQVGAKAMRWGGARVFANHANILINEGTAKSEDIKKLAALMKSKVKEKFGIELQEEVILLGDFKEDSL